MKLGDILKQKKSAYLVVGVLILILGALTINGLIAGTRHSAATNVLVTISGYTMTLQEAIDNDYLSGVVTPPASMTTSITTGHTANKIWVSLDGTEMTLQAAINGPGLSGSTSVPYAGSINPGHLASEIEVDISGVKKTLQQAIDSGDFACVPLTCAQTGCGTHSDGCGGTLNCGACCTNYYTCPNLIESGEYLYGGDDYFIGGTCTQCRGQTQTGNTCKHELTLPPNYDEWCGDSGCCRGVDLPRACTFAGCW